ncbi:MAG: outer membrane protein transport protein, partial [Pseudolabrys sp.]
MRGGGRTAIVAASLCGLCLLGKAAGAGAPSLAPTLSNPAMMVFSPPGLTTEIDVTAIGASATVNPISVSNPSIPNLLTSGGSGNMNRLRFTPSFRAVYRTDSDWAFGITSNSPYTQETLPRSNWAGMVYARDTRIYTQNFKPQIAYQIAPWLNIGAGLQIQAMQADLSQAFQLSPGYGSLTFRGEGLDFGFALGMAVAVSPRTLVGLGYRSKIDQKLKGTITRPEVPALAVQAVALPASFTLPMPDIVHASLTHRLTGTWTLLGALEWTRWSRYGSIPISVMPSGVFGIPSVLNGRWRDTWSVAGGAQYRWSTDIALRGGLMFETAATTDITRTVSTSTADHIQLLLGLTYELSPMLSLDIGYGHNFIRHVPVSVVPGNPSYTAAQGTVRGEASIAADSLRIGLRYYWGRNVRKKEFRPL